MWLIRFRRLQKLERLRRYGQGTIGVAGRCPILGVGNGYTQRRYMSDGHARSSANQQNAQTSSEDSMESEHTPTAIPGKVRRSDFAAKDRQVLLKSLRSWKPSVNRGVQEAQRLEGLEHVPKSNTNSTRSMHRKSNPTHPASYTPEGELALSAFSSIPVFRTPPMNAPQIWQLPNESSISYNPSDLPTSRHADERTLLLRRSEWRFQKLFAYTEPERRELYIQNKEHLDLLIQELSSETHIGVQGFYETRALPQTTLKYLTVCSNTLIATINFKELKLFCRPLIKLLFTSNLQLIVHGSGYVLQTLFALAEYYHVKPNESLKIFDLTVALTLLNFPDQTLASSIKLFHYLYSSNPPPLGTVNEDPTSTEFLCYLNNQVRGFHGCFNYCLEALRSKDRLAIFLEEMMLISNIELYSAPNVETVWRNNPFSVLLYSCSIELFTMRQLSKWRYEFAAQRACRLNEVLGDDTIYELSVKRPHSMEALRLWDTALPFRVRTDTYILQMILAQIGIAERDFALFHEAYSVDTNAIYNKKLNSPPFHRYSSIVGERLNVPLYSALVKNLSVLCHKQSMSSILLVSRNDLDVLASSNKEALQTILNLDQSALTTLPLPYLDLERENNRSHKFSRYPESTFNQEQCISEGIAKLPTPWKESSFRPMDPEDEKTPLHFLQLANTTAIPHELPVPNTFTSFTLEEQIESLKRLPILNGWRRNMLGLPLVQRAMQFLALVEVGKFLPQYLEQLQYTIPKLRGAYPSYFAFEHDMPPTLKTSGNKKVDLKSTPLLINRAMNLMEELQAMEDLELSDLDVEPQSQQKHAQAQGESSEAWDFTDWKFGNNPEGNVSPQHELLHESEVNATTNKAPQNLSSNWEFP